MFPSSTGRYVSLSSTRRPESGLLKACPIWEADQTRYPRPERGRSALFRGGPYISFNKHACHPTCLPSHRPAVFGNMIGEVAWLFNISRWGNGPVICKDVLLYLGAGNRNEAIPMGHPELRNYSELNMTPWIPTCRPTCLPFHQTLTMHSQKKFTIGR